MFNRVEMRPRSSQSRQVRSKRSKPLALAPILALSGLLAIVGMSTAQASVIRIDANKLDAQRSPNTGQFGQSFTGTLTLAADNDTSIRDIETGSRGNLSSQYDDYNQALQDFDVTISLDNGDVTGGSFNLTLDNGDGYNATLEPASGSVYTVFDFAGQKFGVSALTNTGGFTDADNDGKFGGVQINPAFFSQSIDGSLITFHYDGKPQDASVDIDFGAVVPEPGSLALFAGLIVLASLSTRPRQRRA